jgi:hypothetical protein
LFYHWLPNTEPPLTRLCFERLVYKQLPEISNPLSLLSGLITTNPPERAEAKGFQAEEACVRIVPEQSLCQAGLFLCICQFFP